ncbi:MAG TPA: SpoIID/LytB domain-containing protein [Gemmatimonadota bacterium]|nr:SpoIID/LytB domain-containing protein [Gemmatimonadota bacterium]
MPVITLLSSLVACGGERTPPGRLPSATPESATLSPPVLPTREPAIRVGIALGDSALSISGPGRWRIGEAGEARPVAVVEGGAPWTVVKLPFEGLLRVRRPDGYLSQPHAGPLRVDPIGAGTLRVDGVPYAGSLEFLLRPDGTVTAVNLVPLERYLEGVVSRELGHSERSAWEAQRAQAIAARTYALKRLGSRAELGFDVYGSVLDQAYGGVPGPADSLAVRAVRSTRGQALLYGGHLIDAYYHSTCGGSTARVELVFDDPPAPYLVPVSDRRPDGSYWCQGSRYFRWTAALGGPELQAMMERNLPALVPLPPQGVGRVEDVQVERTTPEGRTLSVQVITTTGRYLVSENAIRSLFADGDGRLLRSTQFLLRPTYRSGALERLTLIGGGWGHGVGMCQVGALERAREGQDHRHILATYYPGTEVVPLYP